jgi:hypothetical protein
MSYLPVKRNVLYRGRRVGEKRGDTAVTADDRPLDPRTDLYQHSQRLDWGSGGDEAAQLSLALLSHHVGISSRALSEHQAFKWSVVARLPIEGWTLTSDEIADALERIERARR